MAAQFIARNLLGESFILVEAWFAPSWITRASNSLPVPLSPVNKTVDLVGATLFANSMVWRIA